MNQNSRQADFVLGNCPECQKVIRIPVTAVTSQSNSQVKCPICEASFEIADVLEQTIPAVEVLDESSTSTPAAPATSSEKRPERINAIDTPDLFHVSKEGYQPTTEKKNGRFVVPELLSKGNKSQKKRKRSRSRRRRENDPKLAESLAKLKENTSKTSLEESAEGAASNGVVEQRSEHSRESSDHNGEHKESRRSSSRGERGSSSRGERGSSSRGERKSSSRGERGSSTRGSSKREATIGNRWRSMKNRLKGSRNFGAGRLGSKAELIMIGIGLMLAIPLLHLLLWWMAGVDPLGLSKPTARIMPFLVPSSMRAPVETETVDEPRSRAQEPIIERRTQATITRDEDGKLPKPKLDPSSIHSDNF